MATILPIYKFIAQISLSLLAWAQISNLA